MRKKLIFGTVLVLTLLLLMPSITALEQKMIDNKIEEEIINEKLEDIKELFNSGKLDKIKHPFLLFAIKLAASIRCLHGLLLLLISCNIESNGREMIFERNYLIIYIRAVMLLKSRVLFLDFCQYCSDYFCWNWDIWGFD